MTNTQRTQDVIDALEGVTAPDAAFGQVDVSTTPVEVLTASPDREAFLVQVNSGGPVFVGFDSTVTTGTGVELPDKSKFADETYTGPLFAVAGSGTADVRFQEILSQ